METQPEFQQMGLRDRKKLKTRLAIQQQAMRLFKDQGYTATTVEQIAEAAEISPSTFFRYFPTKESVVLTDFYDPIFMEYFLAQPSDMPPLQAFRQAIQAAAGSMSKAEWSSETERGKLILTVPELRAAIMNNFLNTFQLVIEALAKRTNRTPEDPAVRMFAGAFFGIILSVALTWMEEPDKDMLALIDEAIVYMEDFSFTGSL